MRLAFKVTVATRSGGRLNFSRCFVIRSISSSSLCNKFPDEDLPCPFVSSTDGSGRLCVSNCRWTLCLSGVRAVCSAHAQLKRGLPGSPVYGISQLMKRLLTILGLIAAFFALEVAVCSGQSHPATGGVPNAAACGALDVQLKSLSRD